MSDRKMEDDFFADSEALAEMEAHRAPIKPSNDGKGTAFIALSNPVKKTTRDGRDTWTVPAVRVLTVDGKLKTADANAVWFLNDSQQKLLHNVMKENKLTDIAGKGFFLYGEPYPGRGALKGYTLYDDVALELTDAFKKVDLNRAIADYRASLQD